MLYLRASVLEGFWAKPSLAGPKAQRILTRVSATHPYYRHSALRTSSLSLMPNADAKAWAISIPMLTFPSSMALIYVL